MEHYIRLSIDLLFFLLQEMCEMLVGVARSCGIQIVRNLDAKEYAEFLKERTKIIDAQRKELEEKREARMLRTGA